MGNQQAIAEKSNYFSVDYLNGGGSSGVDSLQQFDSASNSTEEQYLSKQPSPKPLTTFRTLQKSTVQRNKSYVRPENKVLPRELPTKALRQTNLLANEGYKKTWRNQQPHNKKKQILRFHGIDCDNDSLSSHDDDWEKNKSIESLNNVRIKNEIKNFREKYSRSMSNIQNEWIPPIETNMVEQKTKNVSINRKLSKISPKSHNEDLNFTGPVKIESNKKISNTKSLVEQSLAESLALEKSDNAKLKLKSKSFTSERNSLKKSKKKEQIASIKRQKKNKNIDPAKDIQIISRFPINSKVYRHYVAGGHIPEKFTCQKQPQSKGVSNNERAIDVVPIKNEPLDDQKLIEQFISQIYDCIDEYSQERQSPLLKTKQELCNNCSKLKINEKIQKFEEQKITIKPLEPVRKPPTSFNNKPLLNNKPPISRKCSMNCDKMEPIIEENNQKVKRKSTFDRTQFQHQQRLNEKLQSEIQKAYEERKKRFNQVKIALRSNSIVEKERPLLRDKSLIQQQHHQTKINNVNTNRQILINDNINNSRPQLHSPIPSPPLLPPQTYPSFNNSLSSYYSSSFLPLPPPPPPANFDDDLTSSFIDDMIIKNKNGEIDNFILKTRPIIKSNEFEQIQTNNYFKPIQQDESPVNQQSLQKSRRKGLNEIFPEIQNAIQEAGKVEYDYSWSNQSAIENKRDSPDQICSRLSAVRIDHDWCPASDLGDFDLDENDSFKEKKCKSKQKEFIIAPPKQFTKTQSISKKPSNHQHGIKKTNSKIHSNSHKNTSAQYKSNNPLLPRKKSSLKSDTSFHDYQSIIYDSHNKDLYNIHFNRSSFNLSIYNDSLNEKLAHLPALPPPLPPAPWNSNLNKWIIRRASSPQDPVVQSIKLRASKRRGKRGAIVYKNSRNKKTIEQLKNEEETLRRNRIQKQRSKDINEFSDENNCLTPSDILDSIIYDTDKSSIGKNSIEKKNPIYFSDNESIYNGLLQ